MTAYVDTSALLRVVLREPGALQELPTYDALVSSELINLESRRTLDSLRLQGALTPQESAERLKVVVAPLGTLEAIHLATALIWRDRVSPIAVVATHDEALALAARTFGVDVIGV